MQPTDCPVAHLQLAQIQFYLLARLQLDIQLATAMGAGTFKTQITPCKNPNEWPRCVYIYIYS